MIPRADHLSRIEELLSVVPIVGIVGARQVGKTTLARAFLEGFGGPTRHFDLENPRHLAALEDPMLALESLDGLVVLDEIQHRAGLFPVLRTLVDRPDSAAKFLVLGSASPELLRQSSETLAGRIVYHRLPGLSLGEVGNDRGNALWLRGGFPRSFLAESDGKSLLWRRSFLETFIERDLPRLGVQIECEALRRFWMMLAHYHGQILNSSELGRSLGVSHTTIRRYLDVLVSTLMVRELSPWYENLKKRQVKSPKIYVRDSGVLHALLDLESPEDLSLHPKVGASWEGFALEQVLMRLAKGIDRPHFWRAHTGAELDLLVLRGSRRLGFEFKRTSSPRMTRSMHTAINDLRLTRLYVVHPGEDSFPLSHEIEAIGLGDIGEKSRDPLE